MRTTADCPETVNCRAAFCRSVAAVRGSSSRLRIKWSVEEMLSNPPDLLGHRQALFCSLHWQHRVWFGEYGQSDTWYQLLLQELMPALLCGQTIFHAQKT